MRLFHFPHRDLDLDPAADETPWADGHASPEDRALGLELELIELQRRRTEHLDGTPGADAIDDEIALVTAELRTLTATVLRTVA